MGVSRADNSVNIWRNLPISNPKPDLLNVTAHTKFGENPLMFTQVIIRKRKKDGPDLLNVNAYSKFDENPLLSTQVIIRKPKYGCVLGR